MAEVLEQLELSVGALGEDGGGEGLHDLLDSDILVRELVAGGAGVGGCALAESVSQANSSGTSWSGWCDFWDIPDEAKGAHAHGLQV